MEMKYTAFISYRHSIVGRAHAESLERALKRYAKPIWKAPIAIFRDERVLRAGDDLPAVVRKGLEDSQFLVYLASKEAAESDWIVDELRIWYEDLQRANNLILVHINDRIAYDAKTKTINWNETDALPPFLAKHISNFPLWVDLSWATTDEERDLLNSDYRATINSIVARFRGIPPGEMNDAELITHRRNVLTRRITWAAVPTALVAAGFVGLTARNAALTTRSFTAARLAEQQLLRRDDPALALATALSGVDPDAQTFLENILPPRPLVKDSVTAISRAINEQTFESVLTGHGSILKVYFSTSGKTVVTLDADNRISFWDRERGIVKRVVGNEFDRIETIAVSPNRKLLAVKATDQSVTLWDTETGERLATLKGSATRPLMVFSKDGLVLAVVGENGEAAVWDTQTQGEVKRIQLPQGSPKTIAMSLDAATLVVGTDDRKLFEVDLKKSKPVSAFTTEHPVVNGLFTNEGGDFIFVTDDNRVWLSSRSNRGTPRLLGRHDRIVTALAVSPDGRYAATVSADGTAWIWDLATRIARQQILLDTGEWESNAWLNAADFSPDGSRLALAGSDGTVSIWGVSGGKQRFSNLLILRGHTNHVVDVQFSPDGKSLATASLDATARLWRVQTGATGTVRAAHKGETLLAFSKSYAHLLTAGVSDEDNTALVWSGVNNSTPTSRLVHNTNIMVAAISSDGLHAYTGTRTGEIFQWDLSVSPNIPPKQRLLKDAHGQIRSLSLAPDDKLLAAIGTGGLVVLCSVPGSTECQELRPKHPGWGDSVAFSPDGRWLGSTSAASDKGPGVAYLWDVATRECVHVLTGHIGSVTGLRFDNDGKRVVTVSEDRTSRIWDTATGAELAVLVGHTDRVTDAAFSPDGSVVATTSYDRTVRLWRTEGLRVSSGPRTITADRTFTGHGQETIAVAFDPTGSLVASASRDGTVRIWHAQEGELRAVLRGDESRISAFSPVAFTPNGRNLLTASGKGALLVWDISPALALSDKELVEFAHNILPLPQGAERDEVAAFLSPAGSGTETGSQFRDDSCPFERPKPLGLPPHKVAGEVRALQVWQIPASCKRENSEEHCRAGDSKTGNCTYQDGRLAEAEGNYELARWRYEESAKRGESRALIGLGDLAYLYTVGAAATIEAERKYGEARDRGIPLSEARLGWLAASMLQEPGYREKASEYFSQSAKRGEADGYAGLAWIDERGDGSIEERLQDAFVNYSISERLYEAQGDSSFAKSAAERRTTIANHIPPNVIASLLPKVNERMRPVLQAPKGLPVNVAASRDTRLEVSPDFHRLLETSPFALRSLLGRRLEEIFPPHESTPPTLRRSDLATPEEFKNREIQYAAFFNLATPANGWQFMPSGSCISGYSHVVLFFNHGYLFRVAFRFVDSAFNPIPPICNDHVPIYEALKRKLGSGVEEERGPYHEVLTFDGNTVVFITREGTSANLEMLLRGSPTTWVP
jgi:WD40 repeat protein